MDPLLLVGLGVLAFFAAIVGAIAGLGTAIIMLPFVTLVFGVREAVPILTVAMLLGNAARVWANRNEIDIAVARWFLLGAVPAAAIGGLVFVNAPTGLLVRLLGAFFLVEVGLRYLRVGFVRKMRLRGFLGVGAAQGFMSGLVGAAGPVGAPFYLAYGLVKDGFVGTAAAGTVGMHVAKTVAYRSGDILDDRSLVVGVLLGLVMWGGAYAARWVVNRISGAVFVRVVEAVMVIAGMLFLIRG